MNIGLEKRASSEFDIITVRANAMNILVAVSGLAYMIFTLHLIVSVFLVYVLNIVIFGMAIAKEYCKKLTNDFWRKALTVLFSQVRSVIYLLIIFLFYLYVTDIHATLVDFLKEFSVFYYIRLFNISIIVEIFAFIPYIPGWIYRSMQLKNAS